MNGRTRAKLYSYLIKRDGEMCKFCRRSPPVCKLVIDHSDNDNTNNDYANLQLVCRRCNYLKNPRSNRPVNLCENAPNPYTPLGINRAKEPRFREYVYGRLDTEGTVQYEDIINDGAEIIGISPETAKRYMKKMCSNNGKLEKCRRNFGDWLYGKMSLCVKYKELDNYDNSIALAIKVSFH